MARSSSRATSSGERPRATASWKREHASRDAAIDVPAMGKKRIAVVAARFNGPVMDGLIDGAVGFLCAQGVQRKRIEIVRVPGSFELPLAAAALLRGPGKPDGIVALGTLIRGETIQYEVIAHAVAHGLMDVATRACVPIGFGLIVASNPAQAKARARAGAGNRGEEAARAVLATLSSLEGR